MLKTILKLYKQNGNSKAAFGDQVNDQGSEKSSLLCQLMNLQSDNNQTFSRIKMKLAASSLEQFSIQDLHDSSQAKIQSLEADIAESSKNIEEFLAKKSQARDREELLKMREIARSRQEKIELVQVEATSPLRLSLQNNQSLLAEIRLKLKAKPEDKFLLGKLEEQRLLCGEIEGQIAEIEHAAEKRLLALNITLARVDEELAKFDCIEEQECLSSDDLGSFRDLQLDLLQKERVLISESFQSGLFGRILDNRQNMSKIESQIVVLTDLEEKRENALGILFERPELPSADLLRLLAP